MKKIIIFATLLQITLHSFGQPYIEAGAGMTNQYLSGEVNAGVKIYNTTASIGFISIPDATQPALFNLRAGRVINETWLIYAGYVRVMRSSDDKTENGNSWQTGAQYHFSHYDRGTFYIGGNYTGNGLISLHIGMSGFLMRKP